MKSNNRNLLLIAIVVLISFCVLGVCITAAGIAGFRFLNKNTSEPSIPPTALAPTALPDVEPPSPGNPIQFFDDFTNPDPSWFLQDDEISTTQFANGGLRLLLNEPDYLTFTSVDVFAEDIIIEVEAKKIGGPEENSFGVVCRQQGETYYYFEITSDGYYKIASFVGDEYHEIVPWTETNAIHPGNRVNHIRAECVGSNLMLIVNGSTLTRVQDTAIQDGYVGLVVGTFETPGVDILFDNFQAVSP